MADGDVIDVIGRYQRIGGRDKAEDRLTASLAALLMESPELANRVADHYLAVDWKPELTVVRSQRPIGGDKGWVDLEFDVRKPRRALIWVEAKLRAREGKDQLENYRDAVRKFDIDGPRRLLLLAPSSRRNSFNRLKDWPQDDTSRDLEPYFTTWEDLYRCLEPPPRDGGKRGPAWLHAEVLGYMGKHGLAHEESRIRRLQRRTAAKATDIAPVIETARQALIDVGWRQTSRDERKQDAPEEGYWESEYVRSLPGQRAARSAEPILTWNVSLPDVSAGVRFDTNRGGPISPESSARWASRLLAASPPAGADPWDMEFYDDPRFVWITCSRNLNGVLGVGSVNAKARRLVEFLDAGFRNAVAQRPGR